MSIEHPGKAILEAAGGLGNNAIARKLKVCPAAAHRVLTGKGGISASMALRLEAAFGMSAEYWMDLQRDYDLAVARAKIGQTNHDH